MAARRFSAHVKKRVVLEFEGGARRASQTRREHGISDTLLRRWVQQYREHGERAGLRDDPGAQELAQAERRIAEAL